MIPLDGAPVRIKHEGALDQLALQGLQGPGAQCAVASTVTFSCSLSLTLPAEQCACQDHEWLYKDCMGWVRSVLQLCYHSATLSYSALLAAADLNFASVYSWHILCTCSHTVYHCMAHLHANPAVSVIIYQHAPACIYTPLAPTMFYICLVYISGNSRWRRLRGLHFTKLAINFVHILLSIYRAILHMMKLATLVEFVKTVEQCVALQEILTPKCSKVSTPRGIKITLWAGNMR